MKQLLLFLLFIPSLLMAQEDQKYLAGAIPEEGGKVVFTKEINMPSLSKGQIYDIMYQWAEKFFSEEGRRLVYSDKDKGDIAAVGEEYLVFQSTALSLDRTLMDYRVTIECEDNAAKIKLAGIRYEYNAALGIQPAGTVTPAYALTPTTPVQQQQQTVRPAAPAQQIAQAPVGNNTEVCQGLSAFEPDKIPSTLLNMLPDSRMQVTPADKENLIERYATWKEMGKMFGKNIASISISPESEVYKAVKDNDIYTITFTKKDDTETWFMIQCVKQGESSEGQQKIVIGEILNVWIR